MTVNKQRIIRSAQVVVRDWEIELKKRRKRGFGLLMPTREVDFALAVLELAQANEILKDTLTKTLDGLKANIPDTCTRELYHDGPCNGWPTERCPTYTRSSEEAG